MMRRYYLRNLLPDKVAIINGGTTGMGRSTALLFAEEGCSCVIAGRNENNGKQTAEEASRRGNECIFIPCDITDLKQIKDCVDQCDAH
jgi:NAD(P)-dependent dehydrogenase (short-subunit alcohol dehydrogenase family)